MYTNWHMTQHLSVLTWMSSGLRSLSAARWPKMFLKTRVWGKKHMLQMMFTRWHIWFTDRPHVLTSYLYCNNSSLWVITYWAFLFVRTRFPMILPKASGLKKKRDIKGVIDGRQRNDNYRPDKLLVVLMHECSLPADSLHQWSEHALHPSLGNVLKQLPANPLPHHVRARAYRQPWSHHC